MGAEVDSTEREWGEEYGPGYSEVFQELYESHRGRLARYCYSRLGDSYEAEDVAQEAFARAWRAQISFVDHPRAYAWLRVVAGNLCTDILRRRGRCATAAEIEPGPAQGADDAVLRDGDTQLVRLAMARLNSRHRMALEQRESSGWTYEQMALDAGTTVSSIESLLWRARQGLKKELMALAGPDGLLAGVPILGIAVRRFHSGRARLAELMSQVITPQVATIAVVIGASPAMCAVAVHLAQGPTEVPIAARTVAWIVPSGPPTGGPVAPPGGSPLSTLPAGPPASSIPVVSGAGRSAPEAAPLATRSKAAASVRLQNPVTSTQPDNQRDESMPLNAGAGTDTLGVNPRAVVQYTSNLANRSLTTATGVQP